MVKKIVNRPKVRRSLTAMRPRLVVCASGAGSNFVAIHKAASSGDLPAEIVGLLTNRREILALKRAEALRVPTAIFRPVDFKTTEDWDRAMTERLATWRADWIVLAGFLALVGPKVRAAYPGRVINCHPALLPKFGGLGMYGARVHEAVIAAKEKASGLTAHTIDGEYDRGHILAQTRVPVLSGDDAQTLAARVQTLEHEFYPWVLSALVRGRCAVDPLSGAG